METLDDSIEIVILFQEVSQLFKHSMAKALRDIGISELQYMILELLIKENKLKITELSNELCLSNSTVSGIIDRLENQEMVVRERNDTDKRVVYVSMSPRFKNVYKTLRKEFKKNSSNIMSNGTAQEIHKIFEGISTLKKLLIEQQK
ncbi:MarR family winged helix-turn-helix transcriptional regulator [Clostridium estertheticum]|uniref:MarR family winged helix-turn-helix transcriptional regulator n=1 Tax=Clostridium estertheticum TaxID=238834 RepID=UPI001C0B8EE0|nr:MarR family transcriptional regulator [Clostridium estertheticum]MBU3174123.1 MarR family transcriptional regulator [Clostridium estertheticum]